MKAATAALLALSFAACGRGPIQPLPLPLDRFNCSRCGMLISDAADAAERVAPGEDPRFYDDLGCAASDVSRVATGGRFFVREAGGRRWLPAEEAFFARDAGARTPMSYGLVAFGTEAEARTRDSRGRPLRWSELATVVHSRTAGDAP